MRLNAFIQTLVPAAFGLGFIVFGIVAFFRAGNSQQQFESRLQSIRAGKIQPDTLIVVRKYVDPGRGAWPHVVFSSDRQPRVNIAVTRDFFNSVNLGDAIPAYNFPDGYFIPQNHGGDAGAGKWFFLSLGVLLGAAALAIAFARARARPMYADTDALRAMIRDKMDGH
ncbi:MAG TPA: hypothetical protein VN048_04000 [Verrucomicrobiae bacterium]|jgi:hypothetical protein|nr:hypothetical protein [Verrucomicrobiae bacterium]